MSPGQRVRIRRGRQGPGCASGQDYQLAADAAGFHVGVGLDDLVELVDAADWHDGGSGGDAVKEVLQQLRREVGRLAIVGGQPDAQL